MKRNTTWLIAVLLTPLTACATEPPAVMWVKTYRGIRGARGYSVLQASDGGFVAAGYTKVTSDNDLGYLLLKTNAYGDSVWQRVFVRSGDRNRCRCLCGTSDGGYVMVGTRGRWPNISEPYLVKTDANGLLEWDKANNRNGDNNIELAFSVRQAIDGGYIIGGIDPTSPDSSGVYVVKTDSLGNTQWYRIFREKYRRELWWDEEVPVLALSDGSFIVGAKKDTVGLRLIRLDSQGNVLWDRTYLGQGVADPGCVQRTNDGGFIVTGAGLSISEPNNHGKVYLLKTDSAGILKWCRMFGGGEVSVGFWVEQTADHGYVAAGLYQNPGHSSDGYVVRTDSLGNLKWTFTYDGGAYDDFRCIRQTADGGYIVTGSFQDSSGFHLLMVRLAGDGYRK